MCEGVFEGVEVWAVEVLCAKTVDDGSGGAKTAGAYTEASGFEPPAGLDAGEGEHLAKRSRGGVFLTEAVEGEGDAAVRKPPMGSDCGSVAAVVD